MTGSAIWKSAVAKRRYVRCIHESGRNGRGLCVECARLHSERFNLVHPESNMWYAAKERARRAGIPFTISRTDILEVWPSDNCCPIFGTPFSGGTRHPVSTSASLDRIRPELGYVRGNIAVISLRANSIKQHETDPDALYRVANWLLQVTNTRQK